MRFRASLVLALSSLPLVLSAQLTRSIPAGVHEYAVLGTYEGDPMAPWTAEFELRDTTIDRDAWYKHVHFTPRPLTNATFTYVAMWKKGDASMATVHYEDRGRAPSDCSLSLAGGKITGTLAGTPAPALALSSVEVKGEAVVDFAVGTVLSFRTMADGDTIRLTTFRCLSHFGKDPIKTMSCVAIKKIAEPPRTVGAKPEPVWLVEGGPAY